VGRFEATFERWPLETTAARRWYLQPEGGLGTQLPPADGGASSFEHDPGAGARGTLHSGGVEGLQPDWDYAQPLEGSAISFITEPLTEDMVLVGHASVDLWLRSTAEDADIEVTITEVRPDGMESIIQSGWLRGSHRTLRDDATELRPIKTHREEDVSPMEPGVWTELRVEVMPHGQVLRAGSRLRLVLDTPGDSMALWRFLLTDFDEPPTYTVGHDAAHPSSLVVSVIPGLDVPPGSAPCHALRGQPCREYQPF
jgi:putative CocE/NonD family hydrolase